MAFELLAVVADQLRVGVPLKFSVLDDEGQLLLARGKSVSSEGQLDMLRERGQLAEFETPDDDDGDADAAPRGLFERWQHATRRLDRLLGSLGKPGFPTRCHALADDLMALVARDPDIAIYTTVRQDPARLIDWGLNHALHCAVLGQLAATRIGWPADQVACLVRAALTMNLAIVQVQAVFARLGKITEGQRERLHVHPQLACERLREAGVDDDAWLRAVLEHHEREGGGGYPEGLHQVGELGQALRRVDSFLAKISPRAGRAAMPVQEAAKQLFTESRGHPMAAGIIKEFGIAPPGLSVQLASGELAIVIRRGASTHAPLAAAVTDARGKLVSQTQLRDTAQPAYAIRSLTPDAKALQRVPPERLYGLVA